MSHHMMENFNHLLELIDHQDEVIKKQNGIITRLVNETLEKENFINVMMQEHVDC